MNKTQTLLLELLGKALFERQVNIAFSDPKALYREAYAQKVYGLVYDASKAMIDDASLALKAQKIARHEIAVTVKLNYAHAELGRLMRAHQIPYVTFKGFASSLYYPNPSLRVSGDVDFYVHPSNFERCEQVLQQAGFVCKAHEGKHAAYVRDEITLELHRRVNGVPENALGERLSKAVFDDFIETAVQKDAGQGVVNIPDPFHHGMVLLLHTLSHMTKEGIGLRHLCDWAVFESSLEEEAFRALFEQPLKEFGLWRFAQVLSLCAHRYLGAPYRAWQGEAQEDYLEALMCDMFAAGNFGKKDVGRRQQIKYIAERNEFTNTEKSIIKQVLKTVSKKAALEHKSKAAVIADYFKNVVSGKRKPDTKKTLDAAASRKAIYSEMHLFEENKF